MSNILTNLLLREKRRQLVYTLAGAVILAALVFSASYILTSMTPPNTNDGGDTNPPPDDSAYVLGLNNQLETSFSNDEIAGFRISGNITPAIHPRLIFSEVVPDQGDQSLWQVDANVLNATTMDPFDPHTLQFTFTDNEMQTVHQSFLDALAQTSEVSNPWDGQTGSVPNLLFYGVYFTDGSALQFVWAGYENQDIMEIEHFNWDPQSGNFNQASPATEVHYLSPLSVFDTFISQMQQLYSTVLD